MPDDRRKLIAELGCVGLVVATLCGASVCNSQTVVEQIRIEGTPCSSEIHLTAQNVRLSKVLERLAERLQFTLHFESASDPVVSTDLRRPLDDLLTLLVPSRSISESLVSDPRCGNRHRVAEIWVLANGGANPTQPSRQPTAQQVPLTSEEGQALVLRAHGFTPEQEGSQR